MKLTINNLTTEVEITRTVTNRWGEVYVSWINGCGQLIPKSETVEAHIRNPLIGLSQNQISRVMNRRKLAGTK